MKKIFCLGLIVIIFSVVFSGCNAANDNSKYLRIHIRANDNQNDSQTVKYTIKEKLVEYLTPYLAESDTKQKAYDTVKNHLTKIEEICDKTLLENGFTYNSNAKLCNEYFPLRSYNDFVLESGCYDSLIIELGEAKGDNWWCMVYPPLCFTGGECNGSDEITYKSKIAEIIEQFKQKYLS